MVVDAELLSARWAIANGNCGPSFTAAGGQPLLTRIWALTRNAVVLSGPEGPTIKPVDAFAIDGKIDDGKPYSGSVVAVSPCYGGTGFTLPQVTDWFNNLYLINSPLANSCQIDLLMKAGF